MANPSVTVQISARDETSQAFAQMAANARQAAKALSDMANANNGTLNTSLKGNADALKRASEAAQGYQRHLNALKGTLAEIGRLSAAIGKGIGHVAGVALPGGVSHVAVKGVESAAEVTALRNRILNASGGDKGEVNFADKTASDIARRYPLLTRQQVLEDYSELAAPSADHDGKTDRNRMQSYLYTTARARAAVQANGYTLTPQDMKSVMQTLEMTGRATDPASLGKALDSYVKSKLTYGNSFTADKWRDWAANAKSSGLAMSDEEFYYKIPARLAQGNAARLGNEYAQTMNTILGGHMTKAAAKTMADYGLINADQIKSGGGGKFYISGKVKGSDTLASDPTEWSQTTMLKAIRDHGDLADAKVNAKKKQMGEAELKRNPTAKLDDHALTERATHALVAESLSKFGFRGTVLDNLAHAIANGELIERDAKRAQNARGLDSADTLSNNTAGAFTEFSNALNNFSSVMAGPSIEKAGNALHSLADGIAAVSAAAERWTKEHPDAAPWVSGGATAGAVAGGALFAGWSMKKLYNWFAGGAGNAATGAAEGAAGAVEGAVAGGASGAAAATGKSLLRRVLGPIGIGIITGEVLRALDPEGNLWGLTTPVDNAVKKHLGFNPSKIGGTDDPATPAPKAVRAAYEGLPPISENGGAFPFRQDNSQGITALVAQLSAGLRVEGTVTGEATLNNNLTITASPEFRAMLDRASNVKVPLAGNLGSTMGGSNGVKSPSIPSIGGAGGKLPAFAR